MTPSSNIKILRKQQAKTAPTARLWTAYSFSYTGEDEMGMQTVQGGGGSHSGQVLSTSTYIQASLTGEDSEKGMCKVKRERKQSCQVQPTTYMPASLAW
jgi:hypothetical protein